MLFRKIFAVTFILIITGFISCLKNNCTDTVCRNGGLCVDGHCNCATGFEGSQCETIWNSKFIGSWKNSEIKADSSNATDSLFYNISIRTNGMPNIFLIDSFEQIYDSIICEITGKNSFRFHIQYSRDSSLYIESGKGSIDTVANIISANCVLKLNNRRLNSVMTWSK